MESLLMFFFKFIAPASRAFNSATSFFNPKLGGPKKLPRNLLANIHPYVTRDRVQAALGKAKYVNGTFESYPFSDAVLQLDYSKDGAVVTVAIVAFDISKFRLFPLPLEPLDFKLGRLNFGDVWNEEEHPKKEYSSKFWSLYVDQYYGNPGKYWNWRFGTYSGGGAHTPDFPYDYKLEKFLCEPKTVLINWIEISSSGLEYSIVDFSTFA